MMTKAATDQYGRVILTPGISLGSLPTEQLKAIKKGQFIQATPPATEATAPTPPTTPLTYPGQTDDGRVLLDEAQGFGHLGQGSLAQLKKAMTSEGFVFRSDMPDIPADFEPSVLRGGDTAGNPITAIRVAPGRLVNIADMSPNQLESYQHLLGA